MGLGASLRSGRGIEVAPLSHRTAGLMVFRVVAVAVALLLGHVHGDTVTFSRSVAAAYLGAAGALALLIYLPRKSLAVKGFTFTLLLDGVFLQYLHETMGHGPAVDSLIAAQLAAVSLLASFRSGLQMAIWQSLLMVFFYQGELSGLFPKWAGLDGLDREPTILSDLVLLWLATLTTCAAAAINERELRRRRYDAEVLVEFASELLTDEQPDDVAQRLCVFTVEELAAQRAVVLQRAADVEGNVELRVLAGAGLGKGVPPRGPGRSAMLDLADGAAADVRALRFDPRLDPLLSTLLPGARRVAALPLRIGGPRGTQIYLVVEFGKARVRGTMVERRILSSATQAVATGAIAYSRAKLMHDARRAAITDGLTGLANRRYFDERMAAAERGWRERGEPFALILIDVDFFKKVNDQFGHQVGDQVLRVVARVIGSHAVGSALPARYGGEEFALMLPGADATAAATIAERMRLAIRALGEPVPVSASFGVAAVPEDAAGVEELILASDAALIKAKETGRDRVVLSDPIASGKILGRAAAAT